MDDQPRPARPTTPGSILKRELQARNLSEADFAARIGVPAAVVSAVVAARRRLDPRLAILISEQLGTSAELWLSLESNYRLELARRALVRERSSA